MYFRPVMPLNRRLVLINRFKQQTQPPVSHMNPSVKMSDDNVSHDGSHGTGVVPGWAVILICLGVGLNVGVVVFLISRSKRRKYSDHLKVPSHET